MPPGARGGQTRRDDLVHGRHAHGDVENGRVEVDLTDLLPGGVQTLDRCHQALTFPFPDFTLVRTITSPPTGPGTAPLRRRRPRSASPSTTSRFNTVTRWLPICPAILVPRNTREGVAQAPMAPGLRCFRSVPCDADRPAKPC